MDEPNLKDSDSSDFELDIELCKLINKIPIIGKNITRKINIKEVKKKCLYFISFTLSY